VSEYDKARLESVVAVYKSCDEGTLGRTAADLARLLMELRAEVAALTVERDTARQPIAAERERADAQAARADKAEAQLSREMVHVVVYGREDDEEGLAVGVVGVYRSEVSARAAVRERASGTRTVYEISMCAVKP
jgi:sugar phosphate isomerase/epimerase